MALTKRHPNLRFLQLPQDFALVPVDHDFVSASTGEPPPQSTETFLYLTPKFVEFLIHESNYGRLAYIETECFGDLEGEGAAVFDNGQLTMQPVWECNAILSSLRLIGVEALNDRVMFRFANEIDILGLGELRDNDEIHKAIDIQEMQNAR